MTHKQEQGESIELTTNGAKHYVKQRDIARKAVNRIFKFSKFSKTSINMKEEKEKLTKVG